MGDFLNEYAALVTGVVAAVVALATAGRYLFRRASRVTRMLNEAYDALLGRPEIVHPDTGLVLVTATPGLGKRLADMERALLDLADADDRLTRLERKFDDHLTSSTRLEEARVEEQKSMWDAIRAVAESSPTEGIDVLPSTEQEVTVTETRRVRAHHP